VEIHDPKGLTHENNVEVLFSGNPLLVPETAYEWSYGAVYSPRWIKGLTMSADWWHIDLRNAGGDVGPQFIVDHESEFPGFVIRDATGEIKRVLDRVLNISQAIVEGLDYEAIYTLDSGIFGRGDFGRLTGATVHITGRYEDDNILLTGSSKPTEPRSGPFLPSGNLAQFPEQGARKVAAWVTLDLIASYTFNLSPPAAAQVPGLAKDGGKNVKMQDGKEKNILPVSTAEYNPCGSRAWLNGTTITVGMQNVFDEDPPFVAGAFENNFDESLADIKGRFWYLQLKKRF